jgi:hypothetical protein
MAMKLIETTVLETTVRMRYANDADPTKATETMDFQFSLPSLKQPNGDGKALGDPELQFLAEIEAAALLYAQSAINAEIVRLRDQRGRGLQRN